MKLTYEQVAAMEQKGTRQSLNINAPRLLLLAIKNVSKTRTQDLRATNTSTRRNPKRSINATIARAVLNGDQDVHNEYKRLIKEHNNVNKKRGQN